MKKYKGLIYIISMFIIGIFVGILSYYGYLSSLFKGLSVVKWYYILPILIITFFINILVHELGHLIILRKQGIGIRAIYVLCFTVVKIGKKWHFSIYLRFLKLLGGLVMPNMYLIKDEETYQKSITDFSKGIKAGPLFSLYLGICSIILFVIAWISGLSVFIGLSFYFMGFTILITFMIMAASKVSVSGLYGDFVAYKRLQENKRFALAYILSSVDTSDHREESENFLWEKVIEALETRVELNSPEGQIFITHYIQKIVFENQIGSHKINENLKYVHQNLVLTKEEHYILGHELLYFYYQTNQTEIVARLKLRLEQVKKNPKSLKVYAYWEERTSYLLGETTNDAYKKRSEDSQTIGFILKPLKGSDIEEKPLK